MNNIQKPHKAIYLGLLFILFVLITMVLYIPLPKFKKTSISPTPGSGNILAPTEIPIKKPSTSPKPALVMPTGTGASEDFPKSVSDSATQKQDLKKILPLNQTDFAITFDYETDKFVVTLSEPKTTTKQSFLLWLKKNYPLLPLNKFEMK